MEIVCSRSRMNTGFIFRISSDYLFLALVHEWARDRKNIVQFSPSISSSSDIVSIIDDSIFGFLSTFHTMSKTFSLSRLYGGRNFLVQQ